MNFDQHIPSELVSMKYSLAEMNGSRFHFRSLLVSRSARFQRAIGSLIREKILFS